ncbi:MAG: GntR family transcriptional regulator [Clostridia bacterium]|nr:GntR family transcriptional regulator [Clostridia bacterium]
MHFEFSGTQELYIEIAEKYKGYIEKGIIHSGEKLPSVRQAALELGVNPNTAARAYSLLERDGYIKSFPKKGVYVSYASPSDEKPDTDIPDLRDEIRKLLSYGISKEALLSQIEEIYSENDNSKSEEGEK